MARRITQKALRDIRGTYTHVGQRDSKRQFSYDWEQEALRSHPKDGSFANKRKAAKGFARLAMKVGLRRLETVLIEQYDAHPDMVAAYIERKRGEFRAHFTLDDVGRCCAGTNGCYFAGRGWTKSIIAHEVAHFIDIAETEYLQHRRPGHGPHWLGWFLFLLEDVAGFDRTFLRGSLIQAKGKLSIVPKW